MGDVEELGLRRHFFDQVAETRGVGVVQRGVDFVQKAEGGGVEAEQGEHEAHGGEGFFAAGEEVDGAVFLAGRARHDGHAGGQEVVAYHFEGGFAAAEQGREEGLDFAVDGVEGFFETLFGFVVDLGNGFFQKGDGGLHVFALAAVVAVAFARFFEFLQGGEVDGAEGFDLLGEAADAAVQYFRRFFRQRFERVQIGGAFGQVLMVAFGVNQGFLLLQQGGLGGGLKLRQLGLQGLYAGVLLPALLLNLREFFLRGDIFFVQRVHGFGQLVELDVLLVVLELGFIGEGKLLLAFLPVQGLLFEPGDLLLVVLFLLVELVDGDFRQPVLAVGFQQGKLRLFQTALLLLAAVRGGLLLVFEFGGGFLQSSDVV